jgi:hypothetical protein
MLTYMNDIPIIFDHTVTCQRIARQRIGKQVPAETACQVRAISFSLCTLIECLNSVCLEADENQFQCLL